MTQQSPDSRADRAVAMTGPAGFPGRRLLELLERDPRYGKILALDIRPPAVPLDKGQFIKLDLTSLEVDRQIADMLIKGKVDTFIHLAFLSYPTHDASWGHELESIGTMRVLDACAEAGIKSFIMVTSTMVYGATATNPSFLTEDSPLQGNPRSSWVNDKKEAELQVRRFRQRHPEIAIRVLRPCTVLGPSVNNYMTRLLSRPLVPTVMGYDPLFQFLFEDDLLSVLKAVVDEPGSGEFNIVPDGVIHLGSALKLINKACLPLPHPLAYPLGDALWMAQVVDVPGSFLDYLRYPWVADGTRAREELSFRPRHTTKQSLLLAYNIEPQPRPRR